MRSVLRWLRRIALGALALGLLVVALALITAHTDWGREQLRGRVEAALVELFPGGARVGAIEGSILGTLTVRDVELDGRDHAPLMIVGTLRVAVALWPLVFQTARADQLVAEDVRVFVHGAPPASPARPASRPSSPSLWRVELPHIAVHRAAVEVELGGVRQTLAALDVAGAATVAHGTIAMFGWAAGHWKERGAALTATAAVVLDDAGQGVCVPVALVSLGGATAAATQLALDGDHPRGALAVSASGATLATLVPELGLTGDEAAQLGAIVVTAGATAAAPAQRSATRLEVNATAGPARLWASLHGEPVRQVAGGVISAAGIDLALVTRGRLCGRGDALAALDAGEGHLRGTLLLGGGLLAAFDRVEPAPGVQVAACGDPPLPSYGALVTLDATREDATAMRGDATAMRDGAAARCQDATREDATAMVFGHGGDARQVFAIASAQRDGGAIALCDARAVARSHALVAGGQRVTGRLALDASATGALSPTLDVRVAGTAEGRAIALQDIAIAAVHGPFTLRVTQGLAFDAHPTARGIRRGATALGAVHADIRSGAAGSYRVSATAWPPASGLEIFAEGSVTPGMPGTSGNAQIAVALDRSRVTLPGGMIWTGRGGSIAVTDANIAMRDLALHSGDAAVALRGDVARDTGALVARLDADRFSAQAIDPRYRGLGSGTLTLGQRGGVWSADGAFAVAGLALAADAPPVDATAHIALARQRATLDAHAAGPALGSVALALDIGAPRDLFDLRAWQALDASAIRNATVTAQQVALSGLAALGGQPAGGPAAGNTRLTGTIDGTVNLAPAELRGGFAVRGVALPIAVVGGGLTLDGDLTFAPLDGDLGADATARLSGITSATATARLVLPRRPFDPASWARGGRDLLKEAAARLDRVAFDPELLARVGIANRLAAHGIALPYHGRASAVLALDAAATQARLDVDLTDVAGGMLVEPVAQHVEIRAGATGTHVTASWRGPELGLGELEGDLAMTTDRWIADPAAVLRDPITARWTLPVTPALPVLALLGRHELDGGTLEGDATLGGTLVAPTVSARLVARDLAVAPRLGGRRPPIFRELAAVATWDGASGSIEITGHEASGRELHARATGRPTELAEATGRITATQLDVAPLAALLPSIVPSLPAVLVSAAGIVDADLTLRAGGQLAGSLDVTGGALPIGAEIGTLRDATARVTIDQGTIHADVNGKLGGGTVKLTANLPPDLSTIGATLKLTNVSPLVPQRPVITADLTATLRRDHAQIVGDVTVKDATVVLPDHTGTPLLDASVPGDLVFATAPEADVARGPRAPARPWLVASVKLRPTRVEARDVAQAISFQATLHSDDLRVSLGDTVSVGGTVEIENTDVELLGRTYRVEASALDFRGSTDPQLDIHMTHQFSALTLSVGVLGSASNPQLTFSSDRGGYSRDQLFGFLLGGEPGGEPSSQTREAVAGAGSRLISGKLGRQISKVLPIKLDTVSCAPSTTATTATGGSCTFGKWLSRRLFLAYRQHLGPAPNENSGDVQVQIRIGRKVIIDAAGGDRGHHGADLLWQHRW